jgi:hypothetical protein
MTVTIVLAIILLLVVCWPARGPRRRGSALLRHTGPQWRRAYGRRALLRYGLALGAAAVLAHLGGDQSFDRGHTEALDAREGRGGRAQRPSPSDQVAELAKPAGERFWFLAWLVAALGDWLWRSTPFTRWGRANFEACCVGLPSLWVVQRGLGANRPSSDGGSPRWRPLQHANSASGHAFLGAVPWWTLARRLDARAAKVVVTALGTVTGWSRLNDRKHFLSQVLLGWTIAWTAVEATDPPAAIPETRDE